MWLRYNCYNVDTYQSFSIGIDGRATQNGIVEKTIYNPDGGRTRSPVDVKGEWNASLWVFYNMPFKRNKKFSFNTNTNFGYENEVGFVSLNHDETSLKNISRNYEIRENLSLRYSSELFNASIGGNYSYSYVKNTMQTDNNQSTMNFGARAEVDWFLPCGVSIGTDCRYRGTSGYAEGYDQHRVMWNASVAYSFLEKKSATVRL